MTQATIVTPIIGATTLQVWKPPLGVTPGSAAADAQAPFALGTLLTGIMPAGAVQFCRVGATGIGIGATAGITAGVTVAAASGNTWTNGTGQALITGDYVFLTGTPTVALAAAAASTELGPMTEAEREWHRKRAVAAAEAAENAEAAKAAKEKPPSDDDRKAYVAYVLAGGPAAEPASLPHIGDDDTDAEKKGKAARAQVEKDEADAEKREQQRQAQHRA